MTVKENRGPDRQPLNRYLELMSKKAGELFHSGPPGVEKIKSGDFTALYRLSWENEIAPGKTSCIGKICTYPLTREIEVYQTFSNSNQFLPFFYHLEYLDTPTPTAMILLEDIPGPLLKDVPGDTGTFKALRSLLVFHRDCGSPAVRFLSSALPAISPASLIDVFHGEVLPVLKKNIELRADSVRLVNRAAAYCRESLREYPPTLVHGDLYGDNVIQSPRGYKFIDFGFSHIGCGILDIFSFLSDNKRKNGERCFDDEKRVSFYCRALDEEKMKAPPDKDVKKLILCGDFIDTLLFTRWVFHRLSLGLWDSSDPAEEYRKRFDTLKNRCRKLLSFSSG